jgi:protein-L-isoaspartate O-methyltransferase
MRWLVVAVICAACRGGGGDAPKAGSDDNAKEQARFDSERHPEKIIEALAIGPGARVADIGAGSGLLTVHLARAVAPTGKVVATDIDGAVLDLLKQRLEKLGLANVVEPRVVAGDKPGLEAGAYDAILLAEVDHFFTKPEDWLAEAKTALKPHGRIVIENRIYHRAQSEAAAKKAGLTLIAESNPVPTHFIAVFVAGESK